MPLKESYTSIRLLMKCRLNTFADLWDFTQNRWSVTRLATSLGQPLLDCALTRIVNALDEQLDWTYDNTPLVALPGY